MTDYDKELDSLRVEIHFKENGVPSIHAGLLTAESKAKLSDLLRRVEVGARKDELKQLIFNSKGDEEITVYKYQVDNRISKLEGEVNDEDEACIHCMSYIHDSENCPELEAEL